MIFAQFQSLYPNGSIISELVQIFQGKYIVRASVQVEGVTRATGMAASETIELAEDQARNRALMVLGITNASGATVAAAPKSISPTTSGFSASTHTLKDELSVVDSQEISPPVVTTDTHITGKSDLSLPDFSQRFPVTSNRETPHDMPVEHQSIFSEPEPETQPLGGIPVSNVTPFTPRNYTAQEEVTSQPSTGRKKKKTEPVDFSDIIAQTDVQIERLRWTPEEGKEYLLKTYGKRGRTLLNEEELLDFLRYLQSQPDPIAGF
jgi:hypothetical protein